MHTLKEILQSTSETLFSAELGEKEVFIDSCDCNGDTPLHVMLWRKDSAGALTLLEAGANPNAVGEMGVTPLHVAVLQSMPKAVEALLSAGANPNIRSEFGKTAKEEAATLGGAVYKAFKNCA